MANDITLIKQNICYIYRMKKYGVLFFALVCLGGGTGKAQYTVLHSFNGTFGEYPEGSLISSGNMLCGMTSGGGSHKFGVVFSFKDTSIHTSINEIKPSAISINIYPNPNPGIFTIQSSVVSGQLSVEIYNVHGEKVLRQTLRTTQDNNRIELNQPNGVYFYRVLEEDGSAVGSGKIVVQK